MFKDSKKISELGRNKAGPHPPMLKSRTRPSAERRHAATNSRTKNRADIDYSGRGRAIGFPDCARYAANVEFRYYVYVETIVISLKI